MRSDIGTWTWAQHTGGALSRREQLHQVRQGAMARLAQLPGPWQARMRGAGGPVQIPDPPDSGLARIAEERARELSSVPLFAHCMRTWMFASLFAQLDGVRADAELLYLACVLHDLGLTEAHTCADPAARCFAVEGARAAHELLQEHGAPAHRADTVANAISLHLNVNVELDHGPEAHLLSSAAALDVVGRRLGDMPQAARTEVIARWPRDDFATALTPVIGEQARLRPQSRIALLHRLGFAAMVAANPIE